jgi:S-adenosylmethionine:tRNA ribosyltransferase-isomerase
MHEIDLKQFHYHLPEENIAAHPVEPRDASKLLCYRNGVMSHHIFSDLPTLLPEHSLLVFNDTSVIPARLRFVKSTGATLEILLLSPVSPSHLLQDAMAATATCTWKAMIGNKKRWKNKEILQTELQSATQKSILTAECVDMEQDLVTFTWNSNQSFSEILLQTGDIPLPPYLNRETTPGDKASYQTIYARHQGAVAAPTAGLHFTPEVLLCLDQRGIQRAHVTLHVSAGTFQPLKVEQVTEHPMHAEQIVVRKETILQLAKHKGPVVAVGTTSMRTLESLYWYAEMLVQDKNRPFHVPKLTPYTIPSTTLSLEDVCNLLLQRMEAENRDSLIGSTEILIFPGYSFKLCNGLITNFHQPGTTLMLLIAAFVGDAWKRIYETALSSSYRFLSYGDSSLLIP